MAAGYPMWANETVRDGTVIVASDAHWQPGKPTLADRALLLLARDLRPALVILNGDLIDGQRLGRFPPTGWAKAPMVADEVEVARERCAALRKAARGARLLRTLGNHDTRFDSRLATVAPEYAGLHGTTLADHLPEWPGSWGVRVNGPKGLVVKHRFRGGIHAAWNNVLHGGVSIVTGHTHQLDVRAHGDYTGRRYGVECGMLADPEAAAFEYGEGNPSRHCAGFAVLTFRGGRLLRPELCEVFRGRAVFRDQVVLTTGGGR